ncbi:hypothetical protein DID75_02920 [Candidatus Marinamargulisbacteria bacterium SCGC AG-410-N11]|nr:hypothetical protein DID75_02920 [Candidatus Marinamargulisbacteria bacterium SCGC AG-410-N11]
MIKTIFSFKLLKQGEYKMKHKIVSKKRKIGELTSSKIDEWDILRRFRFNDTTLHTKEKTIKLFANYLGMLNQIKKTIQSLIAANQEKKDNQKTGGNVCLSRTSPSLSMISHFPLCK